MNFSAKYATKMLGQWSKRVFAKRATRIASIATTTAFCVSGVTMQPPSGYSNVENFGSGDDDESRKASGNEYNIVNRAINNTRTGYNEILNKQKNVGKNKKVLQHVVLLSLKADLSDAEWNELIKAGDACQDIDGIIKIVFKPVVKPHDKHASEGYNDRTQGFTHVIILTLESENALINYRYHELHKQFASLIADATVNPPLIVDFLDKI